MAKDWQVLVAAEQQGMRKLRRRLKRKKMVLMEMMGLKVMMRRRMKKSVDVEEINPTSYIHMGTPTFRLPLNPDWREKISYKGTTDVIEPPQK
jgi:hypothetical protein